MVPVVRSETELSQHCHHRLRLGEDSRALHLFDLSTGVSRQSCRCIHEATKDEAKEGRFIDDGLLLNLVLNCQKMPLEMFSTTLFRVCAGLRGLDPALDPMSSL